MPSGTRPRWIRAVVAAVVLLPSLVALPRADAVEKSQLAVSGIAQPVEIVRDRWGIPHIYARTAEDLFFAQGFNAARDRLWQLDLWRRQGEGRLAEAFGARFVDQDRAARLFLFRGDLDAEFKSYHPQGKKILEAFAAGVNAWVDLTRANPSLLPAEFVLTGTHPGYWTATSPLIRIFGLTRNVGREVNLAQLVNAMGADAVEKVSNFEPPLELEVPAGLDLSLIDGRILRTYNLARAAPAFRPEDIVGTVTAAERTRWSETLTASAALDHGDTEARYESNNWTIAGSLTATGAPILSGDPHRAHSVPSLRYIAHLNAPGWNVIGAGEPSLPGISLGHNDRIAYALTIFAFADEEDLYVYDTNPGNPSQYRYKGAWEDMRIVEESIPVKGGAPAAAAQLKFTRHGPVLFEDPANHKAYALRAAYLEHPGTAAYLASLRVDQAANWQEFTKAMERHYTPAENMVYADVKGNIGWFGGSLAPVRHNWSGALPVPGNGDYEWDGFLPTSELPRVLNPAEGFFSSANQYNLPPAFPWKAISGHEWSDAFRQRRIQEVLGAGSDFTLEDSKRLQYDEASIPARELVPLLAGLSSGDAEVQAALELLRGWDFVLGVDSAAAALYELWVGKLHPATFALYVPASARPLFGSGSRTVLIRLLRTPDVAFGAKDPLGEGDAVRGRGAVLLQALSDALQQGKGLFPGAALASWRWGDLHHMKYEHALSVTDATHALLDTTRLEKGGDGLTVHATSFRSSDFRQTSGASYREVIDLQDWDRSFTLNTPGQSGDPLSTHYDDLFPLWADGTFVPMLFTREKVIEQAESVLTLEPIRAAASR